MPLEIGFSVERIVMQPTSLCNLNCGYCYLPNRMQNAPMAVAVAERVAAEVAGLGNPVEVVWHAGEPLSCGIAHFSALLRPFEGMRKAGAVTHAIQTNGTLINDDWCKLFKNHEFRVGVSFDGPAWANVRRVGWDNRPAYDAIFKGIGYLKAAHVPFNAICVVSRANLGKAKELYAFFSELGCGSVGFNIEEQLGVYQIGFSSCDDKIVQKFWQDLFGAWRGNPCIKVREFERVLPSLSILAEGEPDPPKIFDAFPSVANNGDVVLLAPEFLNMKSPRYGDFVAGNILAEDLQVIVRRGEHLLYVEDFKRGISRCREECEYFATCYGGQAGNKFFELGTLDGAETAFCRHSEKSVVDAILCELSSQKKGGSTAYVA